MFNRSDSSGYPYLVPCVKGYAFSVSPLSMMFAIEFSVDIFYQTIEVPFYSEFAKFFFLIMNGCYNLSKAFFIYLDDHISFIL